MVDHCPQNGLRSEDCIIHSLGARQTNHVQTLKFSSTPCATKWCTEWLISFCRLGDPAYIPDIEESRYLRLLAKEVVYLVFDKLDKTTVQSWSHNTMALLFKVHFNIGGIHGE